MEKTTIHNPTILHFGKNVIHTIGKEAQAFGKKALILYGKGSAKKSSVFQDVCRELEAHQIDWVEFGGIKSNPVVEDVDAAALLGQKENVDLIIAIGGGSVIDSAKFLAIRMPGSAKTWDYYTQQAKVEKALPLFAVLTLAATGSEMNPYAVIQSHEFGEKIGWGHPLMFPKYSYLDPTYTLSVPKDYTGYGIADIIAHCLEAWFGYGKAPLSDKFVIAVLKETLEAGPALLNNLQNYELRERIMYAATMGLNGTTLYGRTSGDWGVHGIGHVLSLLHDVPHGASLSIAYPAWLQLQIDRIPSRIEELGHALFGCESPEETIEQFKKLFLSLDCPIRLSSLGISTDKREEIISYLKKTAQGAHHKLNHNDFERITNNMFEG